MMSLLLFVLAYQDVKSRRNPRLVPYVLLDERTKKSNKDSLREAVRTLLGYGFNLEAPDQDHGTVQICNRPTWNRLFVKSMILLIIWRSLLFSLLNSLHPQRINLTSATCPLKGSASSERRKHTV